MDLRGKTIGDYQLIELIHQGQNTIYKGFQPSMNRQVAVKVLSPSPGASPAFVQDFNEEMGRIAGLTHPNLLPIYDYGQHDDQLYIVSRYVETGSLKDRVPPAFSLQQAQAMITPVAEAVGYLHSQGVVHGNLKPSNILIDPQGQPLLADLGYSQGIDTGGQESVYLSPEQEQGTSADQRTDVYALGALLYHMLVGEAPPPGAAPNPRARRPDLPAEVEAVILKAMAQDPDHRFQTAGEFSYALSAALAPKPAPVPQPEYQAAPPPEAPPQQAPKPKRGTPTWVIFLLGGLAILCLLAALGVGIFAGRGSDQGAAEPAPAEPTPAPEQPVEPTQPDGSLVQGLVGMVESIFDSLASIFESIFGGGTAPEPPGEQPPEQPAEPQPPPEEQPADQPPAEEPADQPPPEEPADAEG